MLITGASGISAALIPRSLFTSGQVQQTKLYKPSGFISTEESFLQQQVSICFPLLIRPISHLLVLFQSQVSASSWKASFPFSSWVLFLQVDSSDWHFFCFPIDQSLYPLFAELPSPYLSALPRLNCPFLDSDEVRCPSPPLGPAQKSYSQQSGFHCREVKIK